MADPTTGQTICSCQYPAGLLAAYPRMAGAPGLTPENAYGQYIAAATQGLSVQVGGDPATLYPTLVGLCTSSYTLDFWVKGSKPPWSGSNPTGEFLSFETTVKHLNFAST